MYSSGSNKLTDLFTVTQNKLGSGAFGNVYIAKADGKDIAVKCEIKTADTLTLLREFKICRKVFMVKKYIKYLNYYNNSNNQEEKKKTEEILNVINQNPIIKVFNHIIQNDMLLIPKQLSIDYLLKFKCIPETYSYIECNDFNFLTMDLCGDNFENILEKYKLSERAKYFMAFRLLHIMANIHSCGIIHRDIKLANFVLDKKISGDKNLDSELYPVLIDMGLGKEYYKYEPDKVIMVPQHNTKSITGTLRYISLNIHEFKSPTIVDDLISLSYALVVMFTGKNLPWVGHKKDTDKFDYTAHKETNCPCGYHKAKAKSNTKYTNTIAEVKFHISLEDLVGNKYEFLSKWIRYLYSLKPKQLPSYNYLFKCLSDEPIEFDNLYLELIEKKLNQ